MSVEEITLPEIGEGVNEGELVQWLVKEGDSVKIDQGLAEILTDKASVEIPSSLTGKVKSLKAKEGDIIQVGQVLMTIESLSQPSKKTSQQKIEKSPQTTMTTSDTVKSKPEQLEDIFPPVVESHVLATPSTRRLARELNVDINQIKGTGNVGRVTREDVIKFSQNTSVEAQTPSSITQRPTTTFKDLKDEVIPLRGIRRKIAEKMQLAKQTIPHFSIMDEADVTALVRLKANCREHFKDIKISFLPFVMKALASACKEFPMLNASIDANQIIYRKNLHIGFAADTPDGLLVPVIKNADQKNIFQMSQEIEHLAKKAKAGQLAREEMTGSTITITNIGSIGGTYATPIINPPEVAIIGMYRIKKIPIFDKNGNLKSADIMNLSCTADHRLIDGAVATKFLKLLVHKIETPEILLMTETIA